VAIKHCFSIKDLKVGAFLAPFFANNLVEAMRAVTTAAQDRASNLHRFSDDFALYRLFCLDDITGCVDCSDENGNVCPQFVASISSLISQPFNNEVKK